LADYPAADVTLLHVVDPRVAQGVRDMRAGLLGRGGWGADRASALDDAATTAAGDLIRAAVARLAGRPAASRILHGRPARAVAAANAVIVALQAPGSSNVSRIFAASAPKPSRSRCSSRTRVRPGPSSTNRTSTVVTRSPWYAQSAPICHVTTTRSGRSHTVTKPVDVSVPS